MSTQDKEIPNPPAFPVSTIDGYTNDGMTLRDYFAAKAITAISTEGWNFKRDTEHFTKLAEHAYKVADAMLKERSKH